MGPGKVWKTGAIVSSYPKPMLVLEGDEGGLDIITKPLTINWVKKEEIASLLLKPTKDLPPITAWDFTGIKTGGVTDAYEVKKDFTTYPAFNSVCNQLITAPNMPFKTVVIDSITRLQEVIECHNAAVNPGTLIDARKWAPNIGMKIKQTIAELCRLQCHVVFILHTDTDKNELTGEITTQPMMFSKQRELVGNLLSQFFYAGVDLGTPPKPFVLTQPQMYVKGIGMRWPLGLPPKVGATFNEIYGQAVKDGEVEAP